MDTTILQIPMPIKLKKSAQEVANEYGFSSLQDLLRVILTKISRRELTISITEPVIHLSKNNAKRYIAMSKYFDHRKETKKFISVDDLMNDIRS